MNGNDYVEKIEEHQQEIEEDFLQQFTQKQLSDLIIYSDFDEFKKCNEWETFCNEWVDINIERWNK